MRSSTQFRGDLQAITEDFTGAAVGRQLAAIDALRRGRPHGVRAIATVDLSDHRSWRFNCHAYSLGLCDQEVFWCLQESHPDAWPNSEFVTDCLLPGMTAVSEQDAPAGALVLYYSGSSLSHSGVLRGNLIHSKWGRCHTWEHGLFELPQSYGAEALYFQPPPVGVALDAFLRFADAA
jgi:hypothetical protein